MTLLSTAEVRSLVQTDLTDPAVVILNEAAEAAIVARWGGNFPTPLTYTKILDDQTLPPVSLIFLERRISTATTSATLTTALGGMNNDLTFTAVIPGIGGNYVSVEYIVAGLNTPLSVAVNGLGITVNVATNGAGAATSTASQVLAALNASIDASKLATAALAPANDGSGVIAALVKTLLAGGVGGLGIITEYWVDPLSSSVSFLLPDDYRIRYGGYALERWGMGTNRRWDFGYRVDIVYVPEDDTSRRKAVIADLIRLATRHTGVKSETVGDEANTAYDSYTQEQRDLVDSLHGGVDFS